MFLLSGSVILPVCLSISNIGLENRYFYFLRVSLHDVPLVWCPSALLPPNLEAVSLDFRSYLIPQPCGVISLLSGGLLNICTHLGSTSDVFLFSCREGDLEVARLLLEFKVNPECADKRGQTPLLLALKYVPGADF